MLARLELSNVHAEWLERERKIPSEIAAEIGIVSRGSDLAFEYRQNGVCLIRKVRKQIRNGDGTIGKTYFIEPSGQPMILFNEQCLMEPSSPDVPLIFCEGELDAASWMAAGATRVVSVPNGAPAKPGEGNVNTRNDTLCSYLWADGKLRPEIEKFGRIILATDADHPGRVLADELAVRLGRSKCFMVQYPDGCKDANEVLVKYGADALTDMIDNAQPLVPGSLVPLVSIADRGVRASYSTGWGCLDRHMMIVPPELIVITGVPNSGKSQWSLALCMNLARLHGLKGAIFQFEDNIERNKFDVMRYARSWAADRNGNNLGDPIEWARRMFYAVSPKEDTDEEVSFNLAWLQEAIKEAATRHGCKWVLIDPWNEIEHVWNVRENETTYTNTALRELKRIARRYQIAIIVVTHPSKGAEGKSIDDLSLYDISGSAAWANKADHGIIIARDKSDRSCTYVKIAKSKDWSRMGEPGTVEMTFNRDRATFAANK